MASEAALQRVREISWKYEPERRQSHTALMQEYLRRSALWAEALGRTADWPWYDVAAELPEESGETEDRWLEKVINELHQHVYQATKDATPAMQLAYVRFISWAAVKDLPATRRFILPDPYEPLIVLFERGGWFRPEQGYVDLGNTNCSLGGWQNAKQLKILILADKPFLDRLDGGLDA